jgi:hypothetical protein
LQEVKTLLVNILTHQRQVTTGTKSIGDNSGDSRASAAATPRIENDIFGNYTKLF